MVGDNLSSLEKALAKTETDADAAFKTATATVICLKKFCAAAKVGNIRELRKTIESAEQAITALSQELIRAKEGWTFDEETYLSGKAFISEIVETARQMGVKIFEQDDRLYCYPSLIRILPNERSILIDKVREKRLRPLVLVGYLKELQSKPIRFNSKAFLESMYSAYSIAVKTRGKELIRTGPEVPLVGIYDLLTLLPGQSKEYSRQEFARDLYLLDQQGVKTTKNGSVLSLHASSGRERRSKVISIVTRDGEVKRYYGISFTQEE
jgi:hypothetical protein